MKPWPVLLSLLLATPAMGAEDLYQWVDEKGNVTYSDLPPPPTVNAKQKRFGSRAGSQQLPYALQVATRNFPVTLYVSDCGDICDKAGKLLQQRGVPFAHKNAKDPQVAEEMRKLTNGKVPVPALAVGGNLIQGFEEGAWNNALDVAGYPRSNMLPSNVPAKREVSSNAPEAGSH